MATSERKTQRTRKRRLSVDAIAITTATVSGQPETLRVIVLGFGFGVWGLGFWVGVGGWDLGLGVFGLRLGIRFLATCERKAKRTIMRNVVLKP